MKRLTKSQFLQYLLCPYAFHHLSKHPEHRSQVTDADRFTMEEGMQFERVVLELFDLENAQPQYEFQTDTYYVKTDIVKFLGENQVELYEIKASSNTKNEYVWDIAFQRFVADQSGYEVINVYLVFVNKKYRYDGRSHTDDLYQVYDIEREVMECYDEVAGLALQAYALLNQDDAPKGRHECALKIKCPYLLNTGEVPDYPISAIPRIKKKKFWDLWHAGIRSINDLPLDDEFTEKQQAVIDIIQARAVAVDKPGLKALVHTLEFPLYFLDYETYQPAVPHFPDYHPYEKFVFQYSLHIIDSPDAEPKHHEYILTKDNLDTSNLIASLRSNIGDKGSIIVWNASFERSCNKLLAKHHPEHAAFLHDVNDRIWDQMLIFKNGLYRHHAFKGSNSIKDVLPVLCPDLNYQDLAVSDGTTASFCWKKAVLEEHPEYPYDETLRDLLEYCKLDTWAMVRVLEVISNE
jgi:hypothetical protein